MPIPQCLFPIPYSLIPIRHSPFPIPHSPFPIPHSPFLVFFCVFFILVTYVQKLPLEGTFCLFSHLISTLSLTSCRIFFITLSDNGACYIPLLFIHRNDSFNANFIQNEELMTVAIYCYCIITYFV